MDVCSSRQFKMKLHQLRREEEYISKQFKMETALGVMSSSKFKIYSIKYKRTFDVELQCRIDGESLVSNGINCFHCMLSQVFGKLFHTIFASAVIIFICSMVKCTICKYFITTWIMFAFFLAEKFSGLFLHAFNFLKQRFSICINNKWCPNIFSSLSLL